MFTWLKKEIQDFYKNNILKETNNLWIDCPRNEALIEFKKYNNMVLECTYLQTKLKQFMKNLLENFVLQKSNRKSQKNNKKALRENEELSNTKAQI